VCVCVCWELSANIRVHIRIHTYVSIHVQLSLSLSLSLCIHKYTNVFIYICRDVSIYLYMYVLRGRQKGAGFRVSWGFSLGLAKTEGGSLGFSFLFWLRDRAKESDHCMYVLHVLRLLLLMCSLHLNRERDQMCPHLCFSRTPPTYDMHPPPDHMFAHLCFSRGLLLRRHMRRI